MSKRATPLEQLERPISIAKRSRCDACGQSLGMNAEIAALSREVAAIRSYLVGPPSPLRPALREAARRA